jgi:hypothetical protein
VRVGRQPAQPVGLGALVLCLLVLENRRVLGEEAVGGIWDVDDVGHGAVPAFRLHERFLRRHGQGVSVLNEAVLRWACRPLESCGGEHKLVG